VAVECQGPGPWVVGAGLLTEQALAFRVEQLLADQVGDRAADFEARVQGEPRGGPALAAHAFIREVAGDPFLADLDER
jgi:hypothetical protein